MSRPLFVMYNPNGDRCVVEERQIETLTAAGWTTTSPEASKEKEPSKPKATKSTTSPSTEAE